MKSLNAMIEQLEGLLGTSDLTDWEEGFVAGICEQYNEAKEFKKKYPDAREPTHFLTVKQITPIENIYKKHFGDN